MGAEDLLVDIPITAGTSQSRVEMVVKRKRPGWKVFLLFSILVSRSGLFCKTCQT
jgi:hypothetical protein